jgi:DNA-binding transcriptional ArsR family regulator
MVLKATQSRDELRLSFPKLRWAEERAPVILGKMRDAKTFELLGEEAHDEVDDQGAEAMLRRVVGALRQRGGILERPALALNVDTDTRDRTFTRALRIGLDRGLLASERKGRKTTYSLTEASWE